MQDPPEKPAAPQLRRRLRLTSLLLGVGFGSVAAIAGLLAAVVLMQKSTPLLTEEEFKAAQRNWSAHGPLNYDMDLVLSGNQTGQIHVEVRQGDVVALTRNGITPSRRTWQAWSVPGLFEIIRLDLKRAAAPHSGSLLRAAFDPELGHPIDYERSDLGTQGSIRWQITRFSARP